MNVGMLINFMCMSAIDPPYLAIMNIVNCLYIVPMQPWLLRAFLNCCLMHFK